MKRNFQRDAKLVLENGYVFNGFSFGSKGKAIGEIVFNTGMTGYQEVMTDPSYFGQILTFTYPEIGNTGINYEDSESSENIVKGIIVRNYSNNVSNWRSNISLTNWMIERNVIGLYGIDTRALVRILRNEGSMNAIITTENIDDEKCLEIIKEGPKMTGLNLATKVSTRQKYHWDKVSPTTFDNRLKNNENNLRVNRWPV